MRANGGGEKIEYVPVFWCIYLCYLAKNISVCSENGGLICVRHLFAIELISCV